MDKFYNSIDLDKMIFCRISWMKNYRSSPDDDGEFIPAGDFTRKNGFGHECWNFLPHKEQMYGYFTAGKENPGAVIKRIHQNIGKNKIFSGKNITIVWVAKRNNEQRFCRVVGWWTNSNIYNKYDYRPDNKIYESEKILYCADTEARNSILLGPDERSFKVEMDAGWMGNQSLIFYADGRNNGKLDLKLKIEHLKFKKKISDYIFDRDIAESACTESAEDSKTEGRRIIQTHVKRERNSVFSKKAKELFRQKNGRLFCQSCKFDKARCYGTIGEQCIEAHHLKPLAQGTRKTKLNDFAMLCPNCHRMVHKIISLKEEEEYFDLEKIKQLKTLSKSFKNRS